MVESVCACMCLSVFLCVCVSHFVCVCVGECLIVFVCVVYKENVHTEPLGIDEQTMNVGQTPLIIWVLDFN